MENRPHVNTVGNILSSHGLTKKRKRKLGVHRVRPEHLTEPTRPNEVWTFDFKGWFPLGEGMRCEPLTVCDVLSHYIVGCKGRHNQQFKGTRASCWDLEWEGWSSSPCIVVFWSQIPERNDAQLRSTYGHKTPVPPGAFNSGDIPNDGSFPQYRSQSAFFKGSTCVLIMSYSRFMYVTFTTRMHLETLIECRQKAFDYCGGWTRSILYDNMKQVCLEPGLLNPAFVDFADYYGFVAHTHRPYRPQTKGKVERMVRYVKDNFLNGRHFADMDDLLVQCRV